MIVTDGESREQFAIKSISQASVVSVLPAAMDGRTD